MTISSKTKNVLNVLRCSFATSRLSLFLLILLGIVNLEAQPLNNYLQFDGNDDYISLNNVDVAGNAITLEALINSSNLSNCATSQCRIISKATSPTPEDHYWMLSTTNDGANNVLRFRVKTNGTTTTLVASVGTLSENTWYHVAATYDGNSMKLFLEGTEVGNTPKTGSLTTNSTAAAWIGGNPPTATGHPWQGGIDDVRIWNVARTQAQIQNARTYELLGNEAGLQAYYKFNEGTGQTINDQTGNNNTVLGSTNSTDTNDPTFAINNPNPMVTLNLNVFLEGAFDAGQTNMTGGLLQRQVVPQGQPYNSSPWNYPGTEGSGWLPIDYPAGTIDWVLVSLRTSLDPGTEVARVAAVLLEDGTISPFSLNRNNNTNPLYVMIEHRNHLPIISAQPIPIINNTISYDFTMENSYSPGLGFGQKQVGTNWVMYGGNADQAANQNSCDINAADRVFWETVNGLFGVYSPGDYNLDGDVNAADKIIFNSNNGIYTTIPKSTDTTVIVTDAVLSCPSPNFELETCSYTFNWVHDSPLSTTVNYDLRINGIDPGLSVVYPANSNTIDICNLLGITTGSGTLTVELLYWYDGDLNNMLSAGVCTIDYDFGSTSTHGQGKTFTQIAADAEINFCAPDGDEAYVAEYLYQTPGVVYWNVVTLPNGEKCVVPVDAPSAPANAIQLPAPSGGDDTQALEAMINGNPGGNFVGTGGTYRLNTLDVNVSASIWNVPAVPVSATANMIWRINATDVRIYDSPIDGQNSTGIQFGWRVEDGAHRFHLINSGFSEVRVTDGGSMCGVNIKSADDFHIAGNTFSNLLNASGPATTSRANAIWQVDGGGATSGGYIVNNYANNFQTNGTLKDAEFYTKQSYATTGEKTKIYANRCVDAGKRFVKFQSSDGLVLSNRAVWAQKTGNPGIGDRTLLTFAAMFFVTDRVSFRNNRTVIEPPVGALYDRIISYGPNSSPTKIANELHVDCNVFTINSTGNTNHNPRVFYAVLNGVGSYNRFQQCSIKDNIINGSGSIEHHWDFRTAGYPDTGWPAGNLDLSGNQFMIPWTTSEYK